MSFPRIFSNPGFFPTVKSFSLEVTHGKALQTDPLFPATKACAEAAISAEAEQPAGSFSCSHRAWRHAQIQELNRWRFLF
jgi:hypothetical protein